MAINTSTITQLISDFRALSQKDSISPESLGVLLQKLADLINSAASDEEYQAIYDAFQNFAAKIAAVPAPISKPQSMYSPTFAITRTNGSTNMIKVLYH